MKTNFVRSPSCQSKFVFRFLRTVKVYLCTDFRQTCASDGYCQMRFCRLNVLGPFPILPARNCIPLLFHNCSQRYFSSKVLFQRIFLENSVGGSGIRDKWHKLVKQGHSMSICNDFSTFGCNFPSVRNETCCFDIWPLSPYLFQFFTALIRKHFLSSDKKKKLFSHSALLRFSLYRPSIVRRFEREAKCMRHSTNQRQKSIVPKQLCVDKNFLRSTCIARHIDTPTKKKSNLQ